MQISIEFPVGIKRYIEIEQSADEPVIKNKVIDLVKAHFDENIVPKVGCTVDYWGAQYFVNTKAIEKVALVFKKGEVKLDLIHLCNENGSPLTYPLQSDTNIKVRISSIKGFHPGEIAFVLGYSKLVTDDVTERAVLAQGNVNPEHRYENLFLIGNYKIAEKVGSGKSKALGILLGVIVGGAIAAPLLWFGCLNVGVSILVSAIAAGLTSFIACYMHHKHARKNHLSDVYNCRTQSRDLGSDVKDYKVLKEVKRLEDEPSSSLSGGDKSKGLYVFGHPILANAHGSTAGNRSIGIFSSPTADNSNNDGNANQWKTFIYS